MLKDIVKFIDVKKVSSILENIINDISEEYNENIDDITYVKFLFHCSCMIERAIRKEPLPYDGVECNKLKKSKLFDVVNKRFKIVEEAFGINIPESEIAYIVEMLNVCFNN